MAEIVKISELTELAEAPADDDLLAVVDTSATATKKIQVSNLLAPANDHADAGDASTLATAEAYADAGDASTLSTAEGYADTGDASTLATAEAYTDTGLATKVPTTRQVIAGTGLTGGGALSADRTLAADFGTGAGKVTEGNDSRLSDVRTPTAHATSHKASGTDEIKLDELGAPTDVTTLDVSITAHGLAPKLPNDATKYLDGTGAYSVPAGSGGGGSSKPFLTFTATDNQPPASNYATPDTRNSQPILCFDAASAEAAVFGSNLPAGYAAGGLEIDIYWVAASATSGNVKWNAAFERHQVGTDNIDSDSFATAQTTTSAANGTNGKATKTTIIFTDGAQMDSLAAGEAFRLKVTRDAADAGDTMTGDAQVFRVVLREP